MASTSDLTGGAGMPTKGCLILFCLPFFLGAAAVILVGAGMLAGGNVEGLFPVAFGVVFGGIPALVLWLALGHATTLPTEQDDGAPVAPWATRPDWAAGRIESSRVGSAVGIGCFALVWNLIAWPAAIAFIAQARELLGLTLLVYLFPLIGLGLLVRAVAGAMAARKYGTTVFEMAHVPGVIGRGIGGLVRTSTVIEPEDGFVVRLACRRKRTTGSGRNRRTETTVLWEHEDTVGGRLDPDGFGTIVPVAIRIPGDQPPTDAEDRRDRIEWELTATAAVYGVDYKATFEVPVFRTEASEGPSSDEPTETIEPRRQPPDSRIRVRQSIGRVEIDFPAGRNRAVGAALLGITAVFAAIPVVVVQIGHFPIPVLIVPALIGTVLLLAVFDALLVARSVVAARNGLTVGWGIVFPVRARFHPADLAATVDVVPGVQALGRQYYRLVIRPEGRRPVVLGSGIRTRGEADWLAEQIRNIGTPGG